MDGRKGEGQMSVQQRKVKWDLRERIPKARQMFEVGMDGTYNLLNGLLRPSQFRDDFLIGSRRERGMSPSMN